MAEFEGQLLKIDFRLDTNFTKMTMFSEGGDFISVVGEFDAEELPEYRIVVNNIYGMKLSTCHPSCGI